MKRLRWKNDKAATGKQMSYAKSLVAKMKSDAPPLSLVQDDPEALFVAAFWEVFSLPDDLTFAEANQLIDYLKWGGPSRQTFISDLFTALLKRLEGGEFTAGLKAIMLVSICSRSTELAVEMLKEKKPELYESAMSVKSARQAAKVEGE